MNGLWKIVYAFWGIVIFGLIAAVIIYFFKSYPAVMIVIAIVLLIVGVAFLCSNKSTKKSKIIKSVICFVLSGVFLLFGILGIQSNQAEKEKMCSAENCTRDREDGSLYCYYHTCRLDGCNNYKSKGDTYCTYHSTTPMSNITITDKGYTSDNYKYSFHSIYKINSGTTFLCYAVLTFYNSNRKELYQTYTQVSEHITGIHDVYIYVRKSDLSSFYSYEWTALRSKPS